MIHQDDTRVRCSALIGETPIDLETLIDKHLEAGDLAIIILQRLPVSVATAGLLAEILVARNEMSVVKSHMVGARAKFIIEPADDDYLILKAIDQRLDRVLQTTGMAFTNVDHIGILVHTINRGLEIACNLTAP